MHTQEYREMVDILSTTVMRLLVEALKDGHPHLFYGWYETWDPERWGRLGGQASDWLATEEAQRVRLTLCPTEPDPTQIRLRLLWHFVQTTLGEDFSRFKRQQPHGWAVAS